MVPLLNKFSLMKKYFNQIILKSILNILQFLIFFIYTVF